MPRCLSEAPDGENLPRCGSGKSRARSRRRCFALDAQAPIQCWLGSGRPRGYRADPAERDFARAITRPPHAGPHACPRSTIGTPARLCANVQVVWQFPVDTRRWAVSTYHYRACSYQTREEGVSPASEVRTAATSLSPLSRIGLDRRPIPFLPQKRHNPRPSVGSAGCVS